MFWVQTTLHLVSYTETDPERTFTHYWNACLCWKQIINLTRTCSIHWTYWETLPSFTTERCLNHVLKPIILYTVESWSIRKTRLFGGLIMNNRWLMQTLCSSSYSFSLTCHLSCDAALSLLMTSSPSWPLCSALSARSSLSLSVSLSLFLSLSDGNAIRGRYVFNNSP